jgi:hypothetical protein
MLVLYLYICRAMQQVKKQRIRQNRNTEWDGRGQKPIGARSFCFSHIINCRAFPWLVRIVVTY